MNKALISEGVLTNIADALRTKLNTSNTYSANNMAQAVLSIPSNHGSKTIIANGLYNAEDDSLDGYSSVNVQVPYNSGILEVTQNGIYNASDNALDGFNSVNVQVPMPVYNSGILEVTQNGIYNASDNALDGFNSVNVQVPMPTYNSGALIATQNGTYNALDEGYDGYGTVQVNVPVTSYNSGELFVTSNGVYNAIDNALDGFNSVNVQVPIPTYNSGILNVTQNGDYNAAAQGFDGFSDVHVNVEGTGGSGIVVKTNGLPLINKYNDPVTIEDGVSDCSYLMQNFINFNRQIDIPRSVTNCYMMFDNCSNFNQPVVIRNTVLNVFNMFSNANKFNADVTLEDGLTRANGLFEYAYNFNRIVNLPDGFQSALDMFNHCTRYNQPINLNISSLNFFNNMFISCWNFNQPISFIGGRGFGNMLAYCYNFNQPITIPESATNCIGMLMCCNNFNQPVIFSAQNTFVGTCIYNHMFAQCSNFNQPILSLPKVSSANNMFEYCLKFNQPLNFYTGYNFTYLVQNCPIFNSDIIFSNRTRNIYGALRYCNNFEANLYVGNSSITLDGVRNIFEGVLSNSKQKTIYCNVLTNFLGNAYSNSIAGRALTWSAITNGYRNTVYNYYLYNNFEFLTSADINNLYAGNTSIDSTLIAGLNVTNMAYMLNGCTSFNSKIIIGCHTSNCRSMLMGCTSFNQPVHILASVTNARSFLWGASTFNSPVTFDEEDYDIDLRGLLCDTAFNLPITFPNGTRNCQAVFQNTPFNQPVTIPDSVDSSEGMAYFLFNDTAFNQSLIIGNNVKNCYQALACPYGIFNQPVIIPASVESAAYMFYGQTQMKSPIVLHNGNGTYYGLLSEANYEGSIYCINGLLPAASGNMFYGKDNSSNAIYVYTPQAYSDWNDVIRGYDLTGNTETWVGDETNDLVYSLTANIYFHCNWDGTIYNYHSLNYFSNDGSELLHQEQGFSGFNGTWAYENDNWSDVPNGYPVTGIKDNITADKNIYYSPYSLSYIQYTWAAQDSSPVNREYNFVANCGHPINTRNVIINGENCWNMGTINVYAVNNGGTEYQLVNGVDYNLAWSGSNSGLANYVITADLTGRCLDKLRVYYYMVYRVNCSMNIATYDDI